MKPQSLIIIAGLPGSGKTTLAKKIVEEFPYFNYVSGDMLRNFLIENISYFRDTLCSHRNEKSDTINKVVNSYRNSLVTELLEAGESVLVDAINFTKKNRKEFSDIVKNVNPSAVATIIYATACDEVLESRLKEREQQMPGALWREGHIERMQNFEEPDPSEADNFFIYTQDNTEEILEALRKIL